MPRNPLTYDDTYMGLPILPEPDTGNYKNILEAIHRVMDGMTDRHCYVFGVLFELNLPWGAGIVPDNHHMQEFTDKFSGYLNSCGIDHRGIWVREQVAPDAQPHWHLFWLLDGNETWSFYHGHLEVVIQLWAEVLRVEPRRGLVHVCTWWESSDDRFPYVGNGGVMIQRNSRDRDKAYKLLFERASYLAKSVTKECTPRNLRKFSPSHLR